MPYLTPPPEPTPPPIVQTVQVPSTAASDLEQGQPGARERGRSPQAAGTEPGAEAREYATVHFPEADTLSVTFTPAPPPAAEPMWAVGHTTVRSSLVAPEALGAPVDADAAALLNRAATNPGGEPSQGVTAANGRLSQATPPRLETGPPNGVPGEPAEEPENGAAAADTETGPAAGEEADPAVPAEAEPTYPRAARPEPWWHNGALLSTGTLLTPSQPTTRPPTPLRLTADYQDYDAVNQVLTASGNVVLRVGNAVLSADRLWANLLNRYVRVEGNVVYTRGSQTVEAESGEYNLLQGQGSLYQARGTLFLPGVETDFGDVIPTDPAASPNPAEIIRQGPVGNVRGTGGITFGTTVDDAALTSPAGETAGGFVRRIRFEAAQLDFDAEGWYAQDIQLTNDPFSPPELVFRGDSATLTRLTEFEDELYVENARAVFDQAFSIPLIRSRVLLQRGGSDQVNPFFVGIGYDGEDRGGLFVERTFSVTGTDPWRLDLTPQLLVQRFVSDDEGDFFSNLGLEADLTGIIGQRIGVKANVSLSGLDLENLENRLRASVRAQQLVGTHTLSLEYSYRDRLFNGSLGFQDVQSSLGAVILSPSFVLGNTGIVLSYQASAQYVTADTDRPELLDPMEFIDLVSLGRFQGSVALSRGFLLWQGEPLPATPDAGLRFTSYQVVPNLQLILSGRGTFTYYTNDDTQESLSGTVALVGEFGHFSRDYFDSTVFNISYRRSLVGEGTSPFFFDRDVDQNVLSGGILQQIYGPFRIGFQTAINLDTGEIINTDYILEYSRRTYGIVLRYNPTQSSGFIGFRLSEFDWSGRAARFGGANIRQVEEGIVQ